MSPTTDTSSPADDGMNDQIRGMLASGMECPLCGDVEQHQHTGMEIRCYRRGMAYGKSPIKGLPPALPANSPRLATRPAPVTSHLTTDPNHPDLTRGGDTEPGPQAKVYLVLSEEERAKGFTRPYRDAYKHDVCGTVTTMGRALSETYARDPKFYGATYCVKCAMHRPVAEFRWLEMDGTTGPTVGD